MINLDNLRTELSKEELEEISNQIKEGLLYTHIGSGVIRDLERYLSELFKRKYVISTPNGTSALSNAFDALELKKGQSFIVPAYAYPSGIHCLRKKNVKLIPVDLEKDSLNINPDKIEECLETETKGILTVNMWGVPAYYREILEVARRNNLLIVEDASRSVGASREGLTSISDFGDISCISLNNYKLLAAGEGGAILTNNVQYHDLASLYGQTLSPNLVLDKSKHQYSDDFSSKNKIHPVGALIALFSLEHLNNRLAQTNENFKYANKKFGELEFFDVLNFPEEVIRGGWNSWCAFYSPKKNKGKNINEFIIDLRKKGCPILREYDTNFHANLNKEIFRNTKEVMERLVVLEGICSYQRPAIKQIDQCVEIMREVS